MHAIPMALLVTSLAITIPDHTPQQDGDQRLVIQAGEIGLADLAHRVSTFLGENHLIDPNDPIFTHPNSSMGKLVLSEPIEFDRQHGREVLQELMFTKNLVLTPINPGRKLYEWINKSAGTRAELIKQRATLLDRDAVFENETTPNYVATVYHLKHVDAMTASGQLRVFTQDAQNLTNLVSFGNGTSLMITGFCPMVAKLLRVVAELDRPGNGSKSVNERLRKLEQRLAAVEKRLGREKK